MRGIEDFLSRPFIWLAKKFSQNQETHKSNQIENDLLGLVVVMSVVDWWKSARTRDATVFLRPVCGGFLSGLAENRGLTMRWSKFTRSDAQAVRIFPTRSSQLAHKEFG